MPRRKSGILTARVDKKKHLRNLKIKQELKKSVKKFKTLIETKNAVEATTFLKKIFSLLDKAAKKGILHSNTANRKKSRFKKSVLRISKAA